MSISFDVNVENEQVVLGALIANRETRRRYLPKLRADRFVDPVHQRLFEALRELERLDVPYAADTVIQLTGDEVKYKFLRELEDGFGDLPAENLDVHLRILDRDAAKEAARASFEALYASLDDAHTPLEEVTEAAAAVLRDVQSGGSAGRLQHGKELGDRWFAEVKEAAENPGANFKPCHFSGLDALLYEGLRPGNVTVLAARPGMGKTTFCSNLLLRQTLHGARCLSVPVEPGVDAVIEQMVCARARVSAEKVIKEPEKLTSEELFRMNRARREILDSDLIHFDDQMGTFDELEAVVMAQDFDLVVIDLWEYLLDDLDTRVVTQQLRRLKKLAKRRKFHVVVVHQIKRIDRQKNPRPKLHELKNSGGYEEVADLVLLLHRAIYYNKSIEDDVLEVDIAKQRRGPQNEQTGFEFDPKVCRVGKHIEDFDPRDLV